METIVAYFREHMTADFSGTANELDQALIRLLDENKAHIVKAYNSNQPSIFLRLGNESPLRLRSRFLEQILGQRAKELPHVTFMSISRSDEVRLCIRFDEH